MCSVGQFTSERPHFIRPWPRRVFLWDCYPSRMFAQTFNLSVPETADGSSPQVATGIQLWDDTDGVCIHCGTRVHLPPAAVALRTCLSRIGCDRAKREAVRGCYAAVIRKQDVGGSHTDGLEWSIDRRRDTAPHTYTLLHDPLCFVVEK